jgi:hypothetical protein
MGGRQVSITEKKSSWWITEVLVSKFKLYSCIDMHLTRTNTHAQTHMHKHTVTQSGNSWCG